MVETGIYDLPPFYVNILTEEEDGLFPIKVSRGAYDLQ